MQKGTQKRPFFIITYGLLPTIVVVGKGASVTTATAAIVASLFTRFCNIHFDGTAINDSAIKLSDCFLSCCIIRHFYECESAAAIGKLVHNNSCRTNFTILCKVLSQVFVLNGEA